MLKMSPLRRHRVGRGSPTSPVPGTRDVPQSRRAITSTASQPTVCIPSRQLTLNAAAGASSTAVAPSPSPRTRGSPGKRKITEVSDYPYSPIMRPAKATRLSDGISAPVTPSVSVDLRRVSPRIVTPPVTPIISYASERSTRAASALLSYPVTAASKGRKQCQESNKTTSIIGHTRRGKTAVAATDFRSTLHSAKPSPSPKRGRGTAKGVRPSPKGAEKFVKLEPPKNDSSSNRTSRHKMSESPTRGRRRMSTQHRLQVSNDLSQKSDSMKASINRRAEDARVKYQASSDTHLPKTTWKRQASMTDKAVATRLGDRTPSHQTTANAGAVGFTTAPSQKTEKQLPKKSASVDRTVVAASPLSVSTAASAGCKTGSGAGKRYGSVQAVSTPTTTNGLLPGSKSTFSTSTRSESASPRSSKQRSPRQHPTKKETQTAAAGATFASVTFAVPETGQPGIPKVRGGRKPEAVVEPQQAPVVEEEPEGGNRAAKWFRKLLGGWLFTQ